MSKSKLETRPYLKAYLEYEIEAMKSLDHENVVKLIANFEDNDYSYLVMPYYENGTLYKYV